MIMLCLIASMIELSMLDLVLFIIYLFQNLIMQFSNYSKESWKPDCLWQSMLLISVSALLELSRGLGNLVSKWESQMLTNLVADVSKGGGGRERVLTLFFICSETLGWRIGVVQARSVDVQALCPCDELGIRPRTVVHGPVVNSQLAYQGRVEERRLVHPVQGRDPGCWCELEHWQCANEIACITHYCFIFYFYSLLPSYLSAYYHPQLK